MREEQKIFFEIMSEFKKLNMSVILPGISHGDHMLLQTIRRLEENRKDSVKVSQVVRFLGLPPPAVSRGLRILDQKGYIRRTVDESDRRNTFVTLTEGGRSILREADLAVENFSEAVFDNIGDETMERLNEYFRRFLEASKEELAKRKQDKNNREGEGV